MHSAVESEDTSRQFINIITTAELAYETEANVLKAVYSEPFSSRSMKIKIFIL